MNRSIEDLRILEDALDIAITHWHDGAKPTTATKRRVRRAQRIMREIEQTRVAQTERPTSAHVARERNGYYSLTLVYTLRNGAIRFGAPIKGYGTRAKAVEYARSHYGIKKIVGAR